MDSVSIGWWGYQGPMVVFQGDYSDYLVGASEWASSFGWVFSLKDPAHPRYLGVFPKLVGGDLILRPLGRDEEGRPTGQLYTGARSGGDFVAVYGLREIGNDSLYYFLKAYYNIYARPVDLHWDERRIYCVPASYYNREDLYILHYLGDTTSDTSEKDTSSLSKRFSLSTFPRNGKLLLNLPFKGNWELSLYSASGALVLKEELFGKEGQVEVELPPLGAGVYFARVVEEGEGLEVRGRILIH